MLRFSCCVSDSCACLFYKAFRQPYIILIYMIYQEIAPAEFPVIINYVARRDIISRDAVHDLSLTPCCIFAPTQIVDHFLFVIINIKYDETQYTSGIMSEVQFRKITYILHILALSFVVNADTRQLISFYLYYST